MTGLPLLTVIILFPLAGSLLLLPVWRCEKALRLIALGVGLLELGLVGWVANEPDGSVRTLAEGLEPQLLRLLQALRAGAPSSRVDVVTETWSAPTGGFDGFSVRSGWHAGG